MKQTTLAMAADQGAGFERYRKPTRREAFLAQMGSSSFRVEPNSQDDWSSSSPVGMWAGCL
jgi:hypothetical protein